MVGGRDTPPDIQDAMGSTADAMASGSYTGGLLPDKAVLLGRECYQASTSWINSSRRARWNDNLRAFQSIHSMGSKYLSGDYRYRSRLFRPKTRTMVRKDEAETAAAFFSNEDVVSVTAVDDDDPIQLASAEINKALLQYRLTNTIPWFLTLVGARQDCDVMGIAIGKAYWKYSEKKIGSEQRPQMHPVTGTQNIDPETGFPLFDTVDIYQKVDDHPQVDLLAAENFRFDPAADWRNPIGTSPYLIELIPMYIADARAKIASGDWNPVSDSALFNATNLDDDITRRSREQGRVPGKDNDAGKPRDFEICWIRENIVRWGGMDWHYLTLSGGGELLTNPRPLEEVYLQGMRPYVCGFVVLEAHKNYPSGKVELIRDLQTQTNDVTNLRLDNVKLTVNPRQFIAEGKGIDIQDARIFNPGKVVLVKDPRNDIVWDRPPEVTASAYQEQDSINIDIDEISGGISQAAMQSNQQLYRTTGNMELLEGSAGKISEYEMRVFAETFVEPMLKQLIRLEQACESDEVILALAGKKAQLYQKYGINEITDSLLRQELTTKVNVGIGATNPQKKLQNFMTAATAIGNMYGPAASQGSNFEEVTKEVFGLAGYKDGARFFKPGFDPSQQQQGQSQPDPMMQLQEMKHQEQMINLQNKAQSQQMEAQQKKDDSIRQAQLDREIAMMKLNNDQVIAQQKLAQDAKLRMMEIQSKQRVSMVQARMRPINNAIVATEDQDMRMPVQQQHPQHVQPHQDAMQDQGADMDFTDPMEEFMKSISMAFLQSTSALTAALQQQSQMLAQQNQILQRQTEIAMADRVPVRDPKTNMIMGSRVKLNNNKAQ